MVPSYSSCVYIVVLSSAWCGGRAASLPAAGGADPPLAAPARDVWAEDQLPVEDALDRYLVNKTGCAYSPFQCEQYYYQAWESYDGALAEWHVALRMPGPAGFRLEWGAGGRYHDLFVEKEDTLTTVREWVPTFEWLDVITDTLAGDQYTPIHVKLEADTMTLSREGAETPLVTRTVTAQPGMQVGLFITAPNSHYGGKILHDCPDDDDDSGEA